MPSTRLVISASPLVKVYLTEWHERLLENPDLINKEYSSDEPTFTFDVPRGIKAFRMTFNKPVAVQGSDDKEIDTLFNWLIGDSAQSHHETDCYGIVAFDPKIDMVGTLDHMASLESLAGGDVQKALKAKKELDKLQKEVGERMAAVRNAVKKESEARVRRAMKTVHNNLIRQWSVMEQAGQGKYPPSISEALGALALDAEIKAKEAKGAKVFSRMNELMSGPAAARG